MNPKIFSQLALAVCLFVATTGIGRAQLAATISDLGSAAPTPGSYDQYMTNQALIQSKPGGLNYYDNNNPPPAMTFTTGNNPGGYMLNSVSFQTGGASSTAFQASQAYRLRIYSLSGGNAYAQQATPTNATLLAFYQTQSFAMLNYSNWLQVPNLNLGLAPNTVYAFSFQRAGGGYMNLGNVAANPYSGGEVCLIQTAGGTNAVNYGNTTATNFDAVFDVGLAIPSALTVNPPTSSQANPIPKGTSVTLTAGMVVGNVGAVSYQWQTDGGTGTLTNIPSANSSTLLVNTANSPLGSSQYAVVVTDSSVPTPQTVTSSTLGLQVVAIFPGTLVDTGTATAPTPGSYDAYQLLGGQMIAPGLNYFSWASSGTGNSPGQTFVTGPNPKGYALSSVAIMLAGSPPGPAGLATPTNNFDLFIYKISDDGTTATLLADVTNSPAGFACTYGNWLKWTFSSLTLKSNSVYAYAIKNKVGNSSGLSTSPGTSDAYSGGVIATIPAAGGTVTYSSNPNADATFDVGMIPLGVSVVVNVAVATPNPAYALSPVIVTDSASTPGTFTYRWFTDDGSGTVPPNYIPVSGANSTNLTVIPQDLNPGGADYTTNYYFVATSTFDGSSATSAVVTVTIHAASAPQFTTTPTPTNLVTFAGDTRTYSLTETGTLPITNQWQFDNGGGFVGLTAKTNATLTLTNLQTSDSGSYQLAATNVVGSTNTGFTLTVLPAPAAPTVAQKYTYQVYTNSPWAYWRLNETGDPTAPNAPTYTAYDYSGHGFNATYGNAVTVSNAGPQTPTFPGFDAGEIAAGTTLSLDNAFLTTPALNLTGKSNVTFMVWINPNGQQSMGAGLLINRGGPDGACGFGFGNTPDHLGYIWNNNSAATYNWDSGLAITESEWNFVAYVITPTNAVVYLGNLSGGTTNFYQANNAIAHTAETFSGGTIRLGGDPKNVNNNFNGLLSEAVLFTNALSTTDVQKYFLTAIGASALAPTLATPTAYPAATVYSGQNVKLSASASGSAPLTLHWQSSANASTWTDVANATNNTLFINPLTVGTIYYQLVATNPAGSQASSSIAVTFNPLPETPAGLWTANFQITNNIVNSVVSSQGTGHYVGRGILGGGSFWNPIPCVVTTLYNSQNMTNATDFLDDGSTHSGLTCMVINSSGRSSSTAPLTDSGDIGNLLNQYVTVYYSPNALQLQNVPAGTYNLAAYGIDGTYQDRGVTFVVHGSNGDQTNSTLNTAPSAPLAQGLNFVVFTNVHVGGSTLNVDLNPNPDAHGGGNTEPDFNGVQLQLVSYDPPSAAFSGTPTNLFTGQLVTFLVNSSVGNITNVLWSFGDGTSVTNASTVSVSHTYSTVGTNTVTLTVSGLGGSSSSTNFNYIVVSANPTPPTISSIKLVNGTFVLSGANGSAGAPYRILTATNVAQPLAGWTAVFTNVFAGDGSYSYTNASPTNPASFFRVVTP